MERGKNCFLIVSQKTIELRVREKNAQKACILSSIIQRFCGHTSKSKWTEQCKMYTKQTGRNK